jgi:hypothetical protein
MNYHQNSFSLFKNKVITFDANFECLEELQSNQLGFQLIKALRMRLICINNDRILDNIKTRNHLFAKICMKFTWKHWPQVFSQIQSETRVIDLTRKLLSIVVMIWKWETKIDIVCDSWTIQKNWKWITEQTHIHWITTYGLVLSIWKPTSRGIFILQQSNVSKFIRRYQQTYQSYLIVQTFY